MAANSFICAVRRALVTLVAACGLVFVSPALAGNGNGNGGGGNGNGCDANGNAYGHTNCPDSSPPAAPPSGGGSSTSTPPAAGSGSGTTNTTLPASGATSGAPDNSTSSDDQPLTDSSGFLGDASSDDAESPPPSREPSSSPVDPAGPTAPPDPEPPVPSSSSSGWTLATSRPTGPESEPAPRPTAPRSRTFSSAPASAVGPDASWGESRPDASWGESQERRYGVAATNALITIRRQHGVFGGLSFKVAIAPNATSFVFRAARSVVAAGGGRLYRIGTWLRSDVPGLTVCLRIQEVSQRNALNPVRTSESCFAPTAKWKHFRVFRRTLARGNHLVFSVYSFGAVAGDSFEIDGFTVHRRVLHGWKRVDAAFGDAAS